MEFEMSTIFQGAITLIFALGLIIFKDMSKKIDSVNDSISSLNKNIATLIANDENKQREIETNREEINRLRQSAHNINNALAINTAKIEIVENKIIK